ncbi:MAG TPA: GNAT family N-acetyltransferase [Negativicutes bacterium]|nr:GNAT family N-acetyltransferase [Negativicutes bacterium]
MRNGTDDNIRIRRAGQNDLGRVLALYRLLDGPYAAEERAVTEQEAWQTLRDDPRQQLLVAETDGRVVGTATVIVVPNIGHGRKPWAAVENVVVAEECRGRGVGIRLMIAAGNLSREAGCYKLVLSSNLARDEAHAFYSSLGWRQTHVGFSLGD